MEANLLNISVKNLFKTFQLEDKEHEVLKNVSFNIKHGDKVGLIGENGAGKTTLLNILCGFLQHDSGSVDIEGNVNALMSLGIGLKEELSGRENIYIDGELHNLSRDKVDEYIEDIIEFTDIGEYIDKPVKIYSSGMKARLSFAMATMIEPEILIIDEVLGVGDANFALKASKRIEDLCSKGKILIVVSHSMSTIQYLTDKTIWLHEGNVKKYGSSEEVINAYREFVHKKEEKTLLKQFELRQKSYYIESDIKIKKLSLFCNDKEKTLFYVGENFEVYLNFISKSNFSDINIKISLLRMDGTLLFENSFNSDNDTYLNIKKDDDIKFKIDFGVLKFSEGTFELLCEISDKDENILAQSFAVMQLINNKYDYYSKPQYFCDYSIEVEK